jgi:protein-disulfide isomerase
MRILICIFAVALAACSRSGETPAAAAPAQPPAEAVVAPAAPADESVPLTPEQIARLVRPHSPAFGPAKAPVTVVEILDPACAACRAFAPVVEQLLFTYPQDVRVVVRYADFHPASLQALRLLVAAQALGAKSQRSRRCSSGREWAPQSGPDPARAWKIAGKVSDITAGTE